jgi:methyl-accepting chemotaxis protein
MTAKNAAKRVNKVIVSGFIIIVCLVMAIAYLRSELGTTTTTKEQQQFQLTLENLSQKIDARIASMKLIAKTVANDKHIHNWLNTGREASQERVLIEKLKFLVKEYGLTSASFADKNTNMYWNHEGFLRALTPEIDTWYFAYLASGEQDLISVYHDKNKKRVDLYVNYQQTEGNGLSGIATSFDGVIEMMNSSVFAERGEIYLVDSSGKIQVHGNSDIAGEKSLQDLFPEDLVAALLQPNTTQLVEQTQDKTHLIGASYIPSMNWYIIVELAYLIKN